MTSVDTRPLALGDLASDLSAASMALARRFYAGATLWCLSPQWPQHAHHLAVEFVHPVIVGKRALPAAAVVDPDPVDTLRTLVTPGDVLLAVGTADQEIILSAMLRAGAWGVQTMWIGAGPRPPAGSAQHVLWVDDRDHVAAHTGVFVLLYHVLWELTHVCFEHPGLLDDHGECTDEVCITCADEGRLGEVHSLVEPGTALVRTASGLEEVDVSLVGPLHGNDLVLVHARTAITRVGGGGYES